MSYVKRKKAYNAVKSPEELLSFMNRYIKYGIYGTDNKVYDSWNPSTESDFQLACQTKYSLCDANRCLKYGYGNCWDQVELERDWFLKNNYQIKTIFIWFLFEEDNNYITHSYLVYKDKITSQYCYFEHADSQNAGIYKFNTYKELIEYQKNKHITFNAECGNLINDDILNHLVIHEFQPPKYGCNMEEYICNILNSKFIYSNGNYIDLSF